MESVIVCDAWSLVGENYHLWASGDYLIYLPNGKQPYSDAQNTRNGSIRLARLATSDSGIWGLRQINRYVPWDQTVELRLSPDYTGIV